MRLRSPCEAMALTKDSRSRNLRGLGTIQRWEISSSTEGHSLGLIRTCRPQSFSRSSRRAVSIDATQTPALPRTARRLPAVLLLK